MAHEFTDKNFEQEVEKEPGIVLVDFWAPWCGPCMMMSPIIEELATEFAGKIKIGKINVDENKIAAEKYEIMSIPALKVFRKGEIIKEFAGLQSKEALGAELEKLI